MDIQHLAESIISSQHCQRNWNLDGTIQQEHIDMLVKAVTQCPSKQNASFYRVHLVHDRNKIEQIHATTYGFGFKPGKVTTNTQTLANLLIVFESANSNRHIDRYKQNYKILNKSYQQENLNRELEKDRNMAIGIASGYANLIAALLGYKTGYCACFNNGEIREILDLQEDCILMLGVGNPRDCISTLHHIDHEIVYPNKPKEPIEIIVH